MTDDDSIEKRYYTISEVAQKFGVKASLVRFWETQFEEIKPRKNKNGVRQYTKTDIEKLQAVYHLVKEKGYTIHGAKDLLREKPKVQDTAVMIARLSELKSFLEKLKGALSEHR